MANHISRLIIFIVTYSLFALASPASLLSQSTNNRVLANEQAFIFNFEQQGQQLRLDWQIAPDYYLYKQQITISAEQAELGEYTLSSGKMYHDDYYGDTEIYTDHLEINIPILSANEQAEVTVKYQGCGKGICYPPVTKIIPLQPVKYTHNTVDTAAKAPFSPFLAFILGILVAFTPCVFPMYPILSTLILGSAKRPATGRILLLSFSYIQGMALTYTLLGILVATLGMGIHAIFQNYYVIIFLSLLFIVLALSMFGVYVLQLPRSLQSKLTLLSNHQQQGTITGVFMMGILAGLICSPCTTASLSAILLYIAQNGNVLLGAITLYIYALGIGLPLILFMLFGHHLLPKSGAWLQYTNKIFGFIILIIPILLLARILPEVWIYSLASLLALSFFAWVFICSLENMLYLLAIASLCCAIISAAPIQQHVLQYFSHQPPERLAASSLPTQQINSLAELSEKISQNPGEIVLLDIYADWCISCKELEKNVFSDPTVKAELSSILCLKIDVTSLLPLHQQLLKHFSVLGLPAILFFDTAGNEITSLRINGSMTTKQFLQYLALVKQTNL